jgi:hypothetical protein
MVGARSGLTARRSTSQARLSAVSSSLVDARARTAGIGNIDGGLRTQGVGGRGATVVGQRTEQWIGARSIAGH